MSKILFKLNNIHKSFGGTNVLQSVDVSLIQGQVHCLVGENGSGKSTLIKILSGIYSPDEGYIEHSETGKILSKISPSQAIKWGIQVIYQDFSLFPNLSVAENIALEKLLSDGKKIFNKHTLYAKARETIDFLGIDIDLDIPVEQISVANKQLVAISRALTCEVTCLVMDEPTTALSQKEIQELFRVVKKLKSEEKSILFVSHKMREIRDICDTITIIRNGQVISSGNMITFSDEKISKDMLGRKFDNTIVIPNKRIPEDKEFIKISNVSDKKKSIKNVSFTLNKGDIVGLIGFLGSGKEEIAKSLFGLNKTVSGNFMMDKKPIALGQPVSYYVHRGIGYIPEDRLTEGLCLKSSIFDNIQITVFDLLKNVFGFLNKKALTQVSLKQKEELTLKAVNMNLSTDTLSGGNQQKVVLAKWLARNVNFLILNGPTVGVDIGAKFYIYEKLKTLSSNGLTCLIISDDLNEVLALCNKISIVHKGTIVKALHRDDVDYDYLDSELRQLQ